MKQVRRSSAALAAALVAATAIVYRAAVDTYFYNDDFQWLLAARAFRWLAWLNPWAHDHFFRPLAELYFHVTRLAWDRSASAYHLASIALHAVNALLVWRAATLLGGRRVLAVAALCFVVQPGAVEAVTWVCSVSTVLAGTFFLLAIWFFVRALDAPGTRWPGLAVACFVFALASHESAVMLLPLLYGVECVRAGRLVAPWARTGQGLAGTRYLPYVVVLALYLAASWVVNTRNYVVTEGYYAPGLHVLRNLVDYVIDLHVGRHVLVMRIATLVVTMALLAFGTGRMRLYTLWIWLTLLPASLFTWPIVARYEYLAAMGLSLLVAELAVAVYDRLRRLGSRAVATAVAALILTAMVARSAVFAQKMVVTFRDRAEPFRTFLAAFQREHPIPPSGVIETSVPVPQDLSPVYLEAAVQMTFDDPTIRLVFTPRQH